MRSVVVTGGASGIGRACVELFLAREWDVLAIDIAPPPSFSRTVEYVNADVSHDDQMAIFVERFATRTGSIDALVNNAAIQYTGDTLEHSIEEWHRTMDVNVRSIALMARACRPYLGRTNGSIVNVSSVHAVATSPRIGMYAASKGASLALTRALAVELAPEGIRVNAVLPGAVDTPMLRQGLGRGGEDVELCLNGLASRTVLGRVGMPEEIARAVAFLADGSESSFITGAALVVDGGATSRLSTE